MEGVKNSSSSCGAVPVRCGPVPLTSALWPPRRPHVPPACQYRLALRGAFVPRDPVAMRDAYPWQQGTTGEDRVSRLKFSLSERLLVRQGELLGLPRAIYYDHTQGEAQRISSGCAYSRSNTRRPRIMACGA